MKPEKLSELDAEIIERLWLLALAALEAGETETAEKVIQLFGDYLLFIGASEGDNDEN